MRRSTNQLKPLTLQQVLKLNKGTHWVYPNLYVHVTEGPKVRRYWVCRYTRPNGRVTELRLGAVDKESLDLTRARARVNDIMEMLSRGEDPQAARRQARHPSNNTFGAMLSAYFNDTSGRFRNPRSAKAEEYLLLTHAKGLYDMSITEIGPKHIDCALRETWINSPDQARRASAAVVRALGWAKIHGYGVVPVGEIREDLKQLRKNKPRREAEHFTAMPYAQIPHFVEQLRTRQLDALSAAVIEFIVLTAVRAGEACKMKFSEVDSAARVWTIPAARTKTHREHRVPLSDRAMELLARRQEFRKGEYVWPSRDNKRPINPHSVYLYLKRTLKIEATIHGFRSSFRDWAGDVGDFAREHIEECLAHQPGAVERAYRRSYALDKRRVIMQSWADYCCGGTSG